jgi:carbamoyltransferase
MDEVLDQLIDDQQIVAIYQGHSEWGPRALGNRSIMFDPRHPEAKQIVNEVKQREDYRPFACSVLKERASEYFEMLQLEKHGSPYMSFAIQSKDKAYEEIPSLVHADGTCRIQTVTEEDNPVYYNLIKKFGERTGTPIIFNTSFNLGGESLVESVYDAIDTCNRSMINHLYIPEEEGDLYIPFECLRQKSSNPEDYENKFSES